MLRRQEQIPTWSQSGILISSCFNFVCLPSKEHFNQKHFKVDMKHYMYKGELTPWSSALKDVILSVKLGLRNKFYNLYKLL